MELMNHIHIFLNYFDFYKAYIFQNPSQCNHIISLSSLYCLKFEVPQLYIHRKIDQSLF